MLREAQRRRIKMSAGAWKVEKKMWMESMLTLAYKCRQKMKAKGDIIESRLMKIENLLIKSQKRKKKIIESGQKKKMKKIKMETESQNPDLPLSLIESCILTKLPAKSVGRCMCVCKQWKSFLSTPSFARMHLQNQVTINDYKLLHLDWQPPHTFRTLPLNKTRHFNPNAEFLLATLDGLVCLASNKSTSLALWNPLTGAYKKLSPNQNHSDSIDYWDDVVGFYMDSSNDYKLIHMIEGGVRGAFIYSLRLDSWRQIECSVGSNDAFGRSQPIFCGNCLYFTENERLEMTRRGTIICFDVETESFRKIRFPPRPRQVRRYYGSLVVLNGCIHLCVSMTTKWKCMGELWRLDGGDEWVTEAAFSNPLYEMFDRQQHHVCTMSSGNWVAVLEQDYSFKRMSVEEFIRRYWFCCSPTCEHKPWLMMYAETLVSPNW